MTEPTDHAALIAELRHGGTEDRAEITGRETRAADALVALEGERDGWKARALAAEAEDHERVARLAATATPLGYEAALALYREIATVEYLASTERDRDGRRTRAAELAAVIEKLKTTEGAPLDEAWARWRDIIAGAAAGATLEAWHTAQHEDETRGAAYAQGYDDGAEDGTHGPPIGGRVNPHTGERLAG